MKHPIVPRAAVVRRAAAGLGRLRLLGPVLVGAAALIVAACNNGSGSGY